MDTEIKQILDIINNNGYLAYVIGGYVRDKLLGNISYDVDIATNAKPKELSELFNGYNGTYSNYGSYKIITDKYNFDITTFRKEISYDKRRPVNMEYVKTLNDDIIRRDFTINTICMDSDGKIIDLLNGMNDLKNKTIRCVGDPVTKIKEDPLRILRALRLSIILGFTIESNLLNAIKKNIKLIGDLSYSRRREELDKILINSNSINGLNILKNLDVLKYLEVSYTDIVYVDNLMGMYAQLNISDNYQFNKEEIKVIKEIRSIIKIGDIDNKVLFNYGLYVSSIAAKILNIDIVKINKMYDALPIKSIKDLDISSNEIITVLNIEPSNIIKKIQNNLINMILDGKLENKKDIIIMYIINNKRMWENE